MKFFGNLTGLAAEKVGKKKDVPELIIKASLWRIINKTQGNLNGLIGESKSISRKQSPHYGSRKWMNNTVMMKRHC